MTRSRPCSGNSTTTTTGSPIRYNVTTPATYTVETVTYAQAIPLYVGGSGAVVTKKTESSTDKGKAKEGDKFPPRSLEARARTYPSRMRYSKTKNLHTYHVDPCVACD